MITLTEEAKEQIVKALQEQPDKSALRVEAETNGTSEFSYSMRLIDEGRNVARGYLHQERRFGCGDRPPERRILKGRHHMITRITRIESSRAASNSSIPTGPRPLKSGRVRAPI